MKKLLVVLLVSLSAVVARADARSSELLARLQQTLKSYKGYEVAFSGYAFGLDAVAGRCVVSGDKYYLSLMGVEVFSDGKLKYEVYPQTREVHINKVDPKDRDISSNPAKAFDYLDGFFTHSYLGTETYRGVKCEAVELRPTKTAFYKALKLYIDSSTGLPAGVVYNNEISAESIDVKITKLAELKTVDPGVFAFDKSKYKDYDVIDFR